MKQNMIAVSAYRGAGFLGAYQKLVRETVIPYQYRVLSDEVEDAEPSHVIENFRNAGRVLRLRVIFTVWFFRIATLQNG